MNDELFFGMQMNMEVFYRLILPFWLCKKKHAQSNQNNMFAYLCNILRKAWVMKLIFCLQMNTKNFYKLIVSPLMCISRHARSSQNNKFTISLQYLEENVKDEVGFCLLIIVKGFLKVTYTIILDARGQGCPNYPK